MSERIPGSPVFTQPPRAMYWFSVTPSEGWTPDPPTDNSYQWLAEDEADAR